MVSYVTPGERFANNSRQGGPEGRSERGDEERNPCPLQELDSVIQPVASHLTGWAILPILTAINSKISQC
jgi:hypothetical protein